MTDTNTAEREALQAYLKDCDAHAIVPDVGGAWHAAFQAGRASLAASEGSNEGSAPTNYVNELLRSALVMLVKAEDRVENLSFAADTFARDGARFAMVDAMKRARRAIAYVPENPPHDSDCSLHNEPAFPAGPCDCSVSTHPSPPEGVAGWKPIETAPKDGTWVELWRTPTDCGRMSPFVIAKWDGTESMFVWPEFCDPFTKYGRGKADADIAEGDCYGSDDFTHWRALSAPPLPASAKEL